MDDTPNLKLPYIKAAQAQKHITHNEAIKALDAIVQLAVLDRDLATPPVSPADGDRYIVAASASSAWVGKDDEIAAWQDNAWMFYVPQQGWLAWVADEDQLFVWDGSAWAQVSDSDLQNVPMLGVNVTADAANRLSVSSPATLLSHEGAGHQVKVNKNAPGDTASFLFQDNWSGRAEIGLTGDDDFHVKVSPDGSAWTEALVIDKDDATTKVERLLSGTITIADDAVGTIPTPYGGGFVFITIVDDIYPQASHSGILVYDTGASLGLQAMVLAASMSNMGTTPLTGTTGTDGRSSVAVSSGNINIENRFGSTRTYSYTFIG